MSRENRLHFFRMCAWGMFDPEKLPKQERKVRTHQIRMVIEDVGFKLHVAGDAKRRNYALFKDDVRIYWGNRLAQPQPRRLHDLPSICAALLPMVDAKFPPNPER